ncbi:MAG: isopeptide-forming domain-containing fimbrial protein, partial [Chloroflexus sp.]|uniref:COG1361 S-layer family protein n=1 Tax=Chloroflexus sp. TaxID=1904827 RepID=UPI0030ABCC0D
ASVSITVQVNATVTGPTTLTNTATLTYTDSASQPRPSVSASDSTQVPAQPNIVLSKTDGSTVTAPGQTLTYTLTFTNTGVGDAYNITLSDTLPPGVTYQSCSLGSLSGTCSESGGVVTFTLTNPLAAGASASVSITVQVNTTVTGPTTLTNTATLDYTDVNGNVRPSVSATDQTQVPAQPNIVLSKTDGSTVTAPNQTLTYTLTFTNTGAGDAYNITLSDNLPASVTYQSCNLGSLSGTCSESGGVVTFTLTNPLAAGDSASVSTTVQVNATVTGPTTLTNTATLNYTDSANQPRPQVSASDSTQVPAQPTIVLSKTDGSTVTAPGQTLTYTLTFTNTGVGDAYNITLSDTLPAGVSYQSCSPACNVSGSTVTFNLGTLAAGASASVSITVQVDTTVTGPTTLTNTATLNYTDSANQPRPQVSASDSTYVPGPTTVDLIKRASLVVDSNSDNLAGPGDVIEYTLVLTNTGPEIALRLNVSDTPDANTTLVVGSVAATPPTAVIVSGNTTGDAAVEVTLDELAVNAVLTITFRVQVNNPLPDSVTEISNQATATGANISSTPSDDPTTTDPDDPTRLRTPPPGGPPTAIVLTELRLVTSGSGWDIVWTTGAEINTRGFLIYRSTAGRDKAQLLTPIPIPARGSTTNGASYRFSDTTALTGVDYSYWLVEIELDGTVNEYGPLQSRGTISQQHRYFIPLIGR